jgi:YfiH family protein
MRRPEGVADPLTPARRRFAQAMRLDPERITYAGAVHGAQVARVDEPRGVVDGVDALITDRPGLPLLALFADCFPLILYSPERGCAALGHAGWRGTAAGIAGAMVAALNREYGCQPSEMLAGVGPGICGGCYVVGEEVARRFSTEVSRRAGEGRWLLDLAEANRAALLESGLDGSRIHLSGVCTQEETQLYSHRRDADGSRFAGLVGLR